MVHRDGPALVTPTAGGTAPAKDAESPKPFQVASYNHLLRFPAIPAVAAPSVADQDASHPVVDAIIVPTVRSAAKLRSAVQLAIDARCQLIPIYTESFPGELSSVLDNARLPGGTPLAVRYGERHPLLDLAASLPQTVKSSSALDISKKRNIGLLIGRACGWTRMLFLDDDIRKINVEKLRAAAALLAEYPVVGLQVSKYPDASVVGHARRLAEHKQEPFISGGSLLVNPQAMRGYFPAVYHEDWLCIMDHLRLGEVAIGGTVGQLAYKPFITPQRARHEEFGDILAAGLLWLVGTKKPTGTPKQGASGSGAWADFGDLWRQATQPQFWATTLSERAVVLDNISRRLIPLCKHDTSPLRALEAAQVRRAELSPEEFVAFTEKWLESLNAWQDRLSALPRAHSVARALTDLGLRRIVRTFEADRPGRRAILSLAGSPKHLGEPKSPEELEAREWPVLARTAASATGQEFLARGMRQVLKGMGQSLSAAFGRRDY